MKRSIAVMSHPCPWLVRGRARPPSIHPDVRPSGRELPGASPRPPRAMNAIFPNSKAICASLLVLDEYRFDILVNRNIYLILSAGSAELAAAGSARR